jgi:hypothetical protein
MQEKLESAAVVVPDGSVVFAMLLGADVRSFCGLTRLVLEIVGVVIPQNTLAAVEVAARLLERVPWWHHSLNVEGCPIVGGLVVVSVGMGSTRLYPLHPGVFQKWFDSLEAFVFETSFVG